MALVTRYINTASTAGGDGTTNATTGGSRAYPNVNNWDAAEAADLVSAGDSHEVICDPAGGVDTTNISAISGWTTGASNTLTIKAASGSEHNGVSRENSGSGYQVKLGADIFDVRTSHLIVEDMELTVTGGFSCIRMQAVPASGLHVFRRCILNKTESSSNSTYLVTSSDADVVLTLENVLVVSYNTRPIDLRTSTTVIFDHVGVLCETSVGLLIDAAATVTNSWFFNNGGAAVHSSASAPTSDSNNACNDTSFTSEGWSDTSNESLTMANEITSVGTDFADPATVDASIKSDGTKTFDDAGTGSLADDITNTSREGTPDIGPYELIGGAASVVLGQLMMMGVGT